LVPNPRAGKCKNESISSQWFSECGRRGKFSRLFIGTEVLRGADIYDKLRAGKDAEDCRKHLRVVEKKLNTASSGRSGFNRERFIPLPDLPLSLMFVVLLLVIVSRVMHRLDYSVLSIIYDII